MIVKFRRIEKAKSRTAIPRMVKWVGRVYEIVGLKPEMVGEPALTIIGVYWR